MYFKYKECQACGTKKSLNVHHNKGYENIGHEKLSELRLLCQDCHYRRHRMSKGIRYWKPDDIMMRVWVWFAKNYKIESRKH